VTGSSSKLDFVTKGTRITRIVGDTTVNAFPEQDVQAKMTVEFDRESAFLAKTDLAVVEMQNLNQVAQELAKKGVLERLWDRRYRYVSAVYVGRGSTIISSKEANSKIEFSGSARELNTLDLGSAAAQVTISHSHNIGLAIVGKAGGAVGLALFRLKVLTGSAGLLAENVTIETHPEWPQATQDDV
jgi:hypothetical protein